MENLIVSSTNLYAILPIITSFKYGYYNYTIVISLSMIASIIYHMIEHHKHNMTGLGSHSLLEHQVCLNFDRFFAGLSFLYGFFINKDPTNFLINNSQVILIALLSLFISEKLVKKNFYIITHSIWHIYAFHISYLAIIQ